MNNLSDGIKDGFALFYLKNKKLHTVVLNEQQLESLDIALKIAFGNDTIRVVESDDIEKYL